MAGEQRVTRRRVVTIAVGACAAGVGAAADAADSPATAPSIADDLAAADRVLGHPYTEAQHRQMVGIVAGRRQRFTEIRKIEIDPNVEPAMTFDARLADTPVPPRGESSMKLSEGPVELPPDDDLPFMTIGQLSQLIQQKKLTATELTKRYLARLKSIGPKLNCVVNVTEDRALREAARADEEIAAGKIRGPLHGIPYGAKDLLAARGAPTTWGVSPYKGRVFDFDAAVVERLEGAGAVLVAKLSLGELAMGDVWFGGTTRNPWKIEEGSGGSSAGPGAAVAAGLAAFAIGSETLGSIVSPCVNCGVTGLRPTYGRVSRFGAMSLCRSMDKLGPMTRCVEDCAIVLHALAGVDPRDTTAVDAGFNWDASAKLDRIRVGTDTLAFDALADKRYDDAIRAVYAEALATARKLTDREPVPVTLPPTTNYSGLASMTIAAEAACNFTELINSPGIDQLVQQEDGSWPNIFRAGSMIPAADYLRGQQLRTMLQREMRDALRDVDVMVTIPFVGPQSSYTNLTGHPSVVTRCGFIKDRPKMIEFIGQPFREDLLLRFAREFERAIDQQAKWPRL
jgi:Asp-tRNA(Asn)/Glu-tRNA(Gln) amidotransferase A subunit family amidase